MRRLVTVVVFSLTVVFGATAAARNEHPHGPSSRDDVGQMFVADDSILRLGIDSWSESESREIGVDVALYSKDNALIWRTFDVTSVQYTPGSNSYYALAKVIGNRIFLFMTWNARYCIIDKKTGEALEMGEGDDLLRKYNSFVPIRLTVGIGLRSRMGRQLPPRDRIEARKQVMKERRERNAFVRFQDIPNSKLKKNYLILFQTNPGGDSRPERRPLFVIIWKSEKLGVVSFDFERTVAEIYVHGRSIAPHSTKKAIYTLQPDYSLKQLLLTEEEVSRLFAPIRSREVQLDQRVDSFLKMRQVDWPKGSFEEEDLLPANNYWEQMVDPHLKVVEP